MIEKLSIELFFSVVEYLEGTDVLSLSLACKGFTNVLMNKIKALNDKCSDELSQNVSQVWNELADDAESCAFKEHYNRMNQTHEINLECCCSIKRSQIVCSVFRHKVHEIGVEFLMYPRKDNILVYYINGQEQFRATVFG